MRLIRTAAAFLAAAILSTTAARAGAVTFTVDAATLQSYLLAVTPYDFVVGKKGLSETLTLTSPRDVRFEKGAVHMKIDCRGTPIAVEEVLDLSLRVTWNDVKKVHEARIESLPLKVPIIGSIDLAEYLHPFVIPSVFDEPVGGEAPLGVEGKITSLRVLDTMIQVGADISFHRVVKPATPLAAPPTAPSTSGAPASASH